MIVLNNDVFSVILSVSSAVCNRINSCNRIILNCKFKLAYNVVSDRSCVLNKCVFAVCKSDKCYCISVKCYSVSTFCYFAAVNDNTLQISTLIVCNESKLGFASFLRYLLCTESLLIDNNRALLNIKEMSVRSAAYICRYSSEQQHRLL